MSLGRMISIPLLPVLDPFAALLLRIVCQAGFGVRIRAHLILWRSVFAADSFIEARLKSSPRDS
jgi:hypothetical protein